jgi:predicted anti-sigma-YlaC factor YlaD
MITCRQFAELLLDFVAGDLDTDICGLIHEHLADCPCCLTYFETYRITIEMTRHLTCTQLPPEFAERLWDTLKKCAEEPEE